MSVSVTNTDAGLSGKTLSIVEATETITGAKTFDRDPSAPFAVTSGSANVANLDADLLDGQHGSYYSSATNLTGTVPLARLGQLGPTPCDGRLTLTSGTPVTTGDVSGAGTIYFTPYKGNRIALYDGSSTWNNYTFTERSLALTLTSGSVYDVFIYDNSGTPTLETLVWTNTSTRATALTTQDGVLVKSGATTRRYLGTIYATGTNTTEDSYTKRLVWNYYNRVRRPMRRIDATASWNYSTGTVRQANNSTSNQLAVVVGVAEVPVHIDVHQYVSNDTGGVTLKGGIGEDVTNAISANCQGAYRNAAGSNQIYMMYHQLETFPAVGYHFYAWLEFGAATTTTWYGNPGTHGEQSGMFGWIEG